MFIESKLAYDKMIVQSIYALHSPPVTI